MRKAAILLLIIIAIFSLASPVYAAIFSNELIENAKKYEGETIVFQGEAIGDTMNRGDHGWINVQDGGNAIGVWAPAEDLRRIKFAGDYSHMGDIVLIEGVFNQACEEHGGDIDIHAKSLTVIKTGREVNHPLSRMKVSIAGILFLLVVVLFIVNRYQKSLFIA